MTEKQAPYTTNPSTKQCMVELLKAIIEFKKTSGYPPTSIDLAEMLNISQPAANDRMTNAVDIGLITKVPRLVRTVTLRGEEYQPPVWQHDVENYVEVFLKGRK